MASSDSSSGRTALLAAAALAAAAGPVPAQSTHLAELQRNAPAVAIEPVAALALPGWQSAWHAPAAVGRTHTGVLIGLDHNDFAALTSVFAAGRFQAGATWQLTFAQTHLDDLFDPQLVDQYPGLGALGASATLLGADAVTPLGPATASVGARLERDELLGETETGMVVRTSAAVPLLGFRTAFALERRLAGDRAGTGVLSAGLARTAGLGGTLAATWSLGASAGSLWDVENRRRTVASGLEITIARVLSLSAAVGVERDPFGAAEETWLTYAAFGLGVSVGGFAVHVRRGGANASQAAPTAVSVAWTPD